MFNSPFLSFPSNEAVDFICFQLQRNLHRCFSEHKAIENRDKKVASCWHALKSLTLRQNVQAILHSALVSLLPMSSSPQKYISTKYYFVMFTLLFIIEAKYPSNIAVSTGLPTPRMSSSPVLSRPPCGAERWSLSSVIVWLWEWSQMVHHYFNNFTFHRPKTYDWQYFDSGWVTLVLAE